MTEAQIRNTFCYHAPKSASVKKFERIREIMTAAAVEIGEITPASRERSTFLTLMQQAQMMGNASIAIHECEPEK